MSRLIDLVEKKLGNQPEVDALVVVERAAKELLQDYELVMRRLNIDTTDPQNRLKQALVDLEIVRNRR